jgi:hypothetical protein
LTIADAEIHRTAEKLVERYGDNAVAVLQERIEVLTAPEDNWSKNVLLRTLTAVEDLLARRVANADSR